MRKLLFFISALILVSCSKSEPIVDDSKNEVDVEMVFITGTNNTTGGFRVNGKSMQIFTNVYQSNTIKSKLKQGDDLTVFLNRESSSTTNKFAIQLLVGGKFINQAETTTGKSLEINYKIKKEDIK